MHRAIPVLNNRGQIFEIYLAAPRNLCIASENSDPLQERLLQKKNLRGILHNQCSPCIRRQNG